jgi:HEAT repeats
MARFNVKTAALVVGLSALVGAVGVMRLVRPRLPTSDAAESSRLRFQPSVQQRRELTRLAESVSPRDPHFAPEETRNLGQAKLFTYLAHTTGERHVRLAALEAMSKAFGAGSHRRATPDEDLETVLAEHLTSKDHEVSRLAWAALQAPLMLPEPRATLPVILAALAAAPHPPEIRLRAVLALDLLRPNRRTESTLRAFESALHDPDTHVSCASLAALEHSELALKVRGDDELTRAIRASLRTLTTHADPAVRGTALQTLRTIPGAHPSEADPAALALTDDPDPYVRAQAMASLGQGPATPAAIARLLGHARDLGVAELQRPGPAPDLEMHLQVPGRRTVAEAALFSLAKLSESVESAERPRLRLPIGGPSTTEESLELAAQEAARWWASPSQ